MLAFLLAIIMVISSSPISVFALDEICNENTIIDDNSAVFYKNSSENTEPATAGQGEHSNEQTPEDAPEASEFGQESSANKQETTPQADNTVPNEGKGETPINEVPEENNTEAAALSEETDPEAAGEEESGDTEGENTENGEAQPVQTIEPALSLSSWFYISEGVRTGINSELTGSTIIVELPAGEDITGYGFVLNYSLAAADETDPEAVEFDVLFSGGINDLTIRSFSEIFGYSDTSSPEYTAALSMQNGSHKLHISSYPGNGKLCFCFSSITGEPVFTLKDGQSTSANPAYKLSYENISEQPEAEEPETEQPEAEEPETEQTEGEEPEAEQPEAEEPETEQPEGEEPEAEQPEGEEPEGENNGEAVVPGYCAITSIEVIYSNDENWKTLTRPRAMLMPIVISLEYEAEGEPHTKTITTQVDISTEECYMWFEHDGNGAGSFNVSNVPTAIEYNGSYYAVTGYSVSIVSELPYYASSKVELIKDETGDLSAVNNSAVGLSLVTHNLTVSTSVKPEESENPGFTMVLDFTNDLLQSSDRPDGYNSTVTITDTISGSKTYEVPVGIAYTVKEIPTEGYKWDGNYYRTVGESGDVVYSNVVTGTVTSAHTDEEGISAGGDILIETVNYVQNYSYEFSVKWEDNNSVTRPAINGSNFELQFYTDIDEYGEPVWKTVNEASIEELGLDTVPALTIGESNVVYTSCSYDALPLLSSENELITYRVVSTAVPTGYSEECENNASTGHEQFVFSEIISFSASIVWNDANNKELENGETPRPADAAALGLKLYRKVGDTEELVVLPGSVDGEVPAAYISAGESDNTWAVNISELNRYNHDNEEFDYYLKQENTIIIYDSENKPLATYKSYYSNSTGSYVGYTDVCHNNGKITERLMTKEYFAAYKVWMDNEWDESTGTAPERPNAIATLYRFVIDDVKSVMDNDSSVAEPYTEADMLDYAWNHNLASVITYTDAYGKEQLATKLIPEGKGDAEHPIPDRVFYFEDGQGGAQGGLDGTDDQGYKYYYFVRETLVDDNISDDKHNEYNYSTVYTKDGLIYKEGVPYNGTIINTRREKASVLIEKFWQAPGDLSSIDGAAVRLMIYAPLEGSDEYYPLSIYSSGSMSYAPASQEDILTDSTIAGFGETVSSGEASYYVNIYDENGNAYDMSRARIQEIVTLGEESVTVPVYDTGTHTFSDANTYTIGGKTYAAADSFTQQIDLSDGTKQFRYRQNNTIYEQTSYRLTKNWDGSIIEERDNYPAEGDNSGRSVRYVAFRLTRTSTGTATSEDAGVYLVPRNVSSDRWSAIAEELVKYDSYGYEYNYKAREIGFVFGDTSDADVILKVDESLLLTDSDYISVETARSEAGWSYYHTYRLGDDNIGETIATNYESGNGYPYFSVSKLWSDNSDELSADRKQVYLRVYDRTELETALLSQQGGQSGSAAADLEALTINHYDRTLTAGSLYYAEIGYTALFRALYPDEEVPTSEYARNDSGWWSRYIVLEYKVGGSGNEPQPAGYSYDDLLAAVRSTGTFADFNGKAENSDRAYKVTVGYERAGSSAVLIRNERIGYTAVTAEKTWNDDLNNNERPEISFQLYRNGEIYTRVAAEAYVTVPDGANYIAELDHETGIVTVKPGQTSSTVSNWKFTVCDLPMFEGGIHCAYNLDELALADGSAEYIQKKNPRFTSDSTGKTQSYTFNYSNTATGETFHVAYKLWQDPSITDNSIRPDIYLTLQRKLKSEPDSAWVNVEDAKDPIWVSKDDPDACLDSAAKANGNYLTEDDEWNWKIYVDGLPGYDANGHEYEYRFTETMNKNGATVLGTYVSTTETIAVYDISGNVEDTYDLFVNTITDNIIVSGQKVWTGLEGYKTRSDDLPDPELILYRTLIENNISAAQFLLMSDTEVQALIENGTVVLVDIGCLSADKRSYSFPQHTNALGTVDVNGVLMLPKYDEQGREYRYLVRERIEDELAELLFVRENTNGTLDNHFREDVNRRTITITKTWDGREGLSDNEMVYPAITFTLYRYELDGNAYTAADTDKVTLIEAKYFSAARIKQIIESGAELSYTFGAAKGDNSDKTKLLIYSPTGVQYGYFITENVISGYEQSFTDEPGLENMVGTDYERSDGAGSHEPASFTAEFISALQLNDQIDIISLPEGWNDTGSDSYPDTTVSVENRYLKENKLSLSGIKTWNDMGNYAGLRPDAVTIVLTRRANNESGQSNSVDAETITLSSVDENTAIDSCNSTEPCIHWFSTDNKSTESTWSYTIHNLERYAPSGQRYIYTVAEDVVEGSIYKVSYPNGQSAASPVNGNISSRNITNSYDSSCYVRKNWSDGYDRYGLRPANVTLKLERSTDGGESWENVPWTASMPSDWSHMTVDGAEYVIKNLTKENIKANTANSAWEYTFNNLPGKIMTGDGERNVVYRAVEIRVGGVELSENEDGQLIAGAYSYTYDDLGTNKSKITNTLFKTSLQVTKEWYGDENDTYSSRPDTISFKLQKRGYSFTTVGEAGANYQPTDWIDVCDENGEPYVYTITRNADGTWPSRTLEDLPVAEIYADEEGSATAVYSLYFRAVEIHEVDNYSDITNYTDDYVQDGDISGLSHYYDVEKGYNVSKLSNELITDMSITVEKTWNTTEADGTEAKFELWQRIKPEGEAPTAAEVNVAADYDAGFEGWKRTLDGTTAALDSSKANTITWANLPKYDIDGNELQYRVVEYCPAGYRVEYAEGTGAEPSDATSENGLTEYTYLPVNVQLQNYTVEKQWQKTADANTVIVKINGVSAYVFTSEFKLMQKAEGDEAASEADRPHVLFVYNDSSLERALIAAVDGSVNVEFPDGTVFTGADITGSINGEYAQPVWTELSMFTAAGSKQITYWAEETKINGYAVTNDKTNDYAVSYSYSDTGAGVPEFTGSKTAAVNRMVYGFVNLSKQAAYLAPEVTGTGAKLSGIVFDIYRVTPEGESLYASDIVTDEDGQLINNNGKYGTEEKYLVSGTYVLKEKTTKAGYSLWKTGIEFTVGTAGGDTDTGEHGTAWIVTEKKSFLGIQTGTGLKTVYIHSQAEHFYEDDCKPSTTGEPAYNIESRGVIEFTKTGPDGSPLDVHSASSGESTAYFGVYTDEGCENQVAGMLADSTGTSFRLTDKAQDLESTIGSSENANGITYLRAFGSGENAGYTLASGTYYIKELVAPAGCRLDNTVRKAVINDIAETVMDTDLSSVYSNNKALISVAGDSSEGSDSYTWANNPNEVAVYKMDQFGRIVDLKGEYLELTVDTGSFKTGESTIRLYQNTAKPATKTDGATTVDGISYSDGHWTITGLFDGDASKTYIVSEPESTLPENHIIAVAFSFKMGTDGKMIPVSTAENGAQAKEEPTKATGNDFYNYYKVGADSSTIVLRDTVRHRENVVLEKRDTSIDGALIPNISFKLYRYEARNDNGEITGSEPVLEAGIYLTTDSEGRIDLSAQPDSIKNLLTGCSLKYGLEIGKYYFEEAERGASDKYLLADKIFFEIKANTQSEYENSADVIFAAASFVSQADVNEVGKAVNTPVTERRLVLTKNGEAAETLAGTRFTLAYTSVTNGTIGSEQTKLFKCITGDDGILYLANEDGSASSVKPDISDKGTYTLVETAAAPGYITPTDSSGKLVTMLTFTVSEDEITWQQGDRNALVTRAEFIKAQAGENEDSLVLTVKNNKTTASFRKLVYLTGAALDGAEFKIYNGSEEVSGGAFTIGGGTYSLTEGILREGVVFTLRETNAPQGYLEAPDAYFMLWGTEAVGSEAARTYIWTGSSTPTAADALTLDNWQQPVIGSGWKQSTGSNGNKNTAIVNNVINVVDEPIIAPVTLTKLVSAGSDGMGNTAALAGAEFDVKDNDSGKLIGRAVTNNSGELVWKNLTSDGVGSGLVYTEGSTKKSDGVLAGRTDVTGRIILRQNTGGYTFIEAYAPNHAYMDGRSYTITIRDEDYTQYRSSDAYLVNIVERNQGTIVPDTETEAVNKHYKSTVTLDKYDADIEAAGSAIAGVEFRLYHAVKNESGEWTTGSEVAAEDYSSTLTTDANGHLSVDIFRKGEYILKEVSAKGYSDRSFAELHFTLTDALFEQSSSLNTGDRNNDGTIDGVANDRIYGELTITKQGDTGELKNVKFLLERTNSITSYSGTDPVTSTEFSFGQFEVSTGNTYSFSYGESGWTCTKTTRSDKKLVLSGLDWGSYKLTEVTENTGYVYNPNEYTFTVDKDNLSQPTVYGTGAQNNIIYNSRNELVLKKTDLGDTVLSGAVFELHEGSGESCGNSCAKAVYYSARTAALPAEYVTSGEDGTVNIYGLETDISSSEARQYHLVETKAPDGYEIAAPVTFTIDRNGNVSVSEDKTVTMQDRPIEFRLVKKNSDDTEQMIVDAILETAVFKLTGSFADGTTQKTLNGLQLKTIDALNAKLIGGNTYTIVETQAPYGYERQSTAGSFTVGTDGTITAVSGSFLSSSEDGTVAVLTYTDEPIEISLAKASANSEGWPITAEQAVFTIKGDFVKADKSGYEQNAEITGLTVESFKTTLANRFIAGRTYSVTETHAPDGFKTVPTFTFKVKDDGTISDISSTSAARSEANAVELLTVTDKPNEITILKKDDNGNLAGTAFTLTAADSRSDAFVNMGTETDTRNSSKIEWTSTNEGFTITNHLIADVEYKLHETRVYNHEELVNDILFKLNQDGTISITQNSSAKNNSGDAAAADNSTFALNVTNPTVKGTVILTKTWDEPYQREAGRALPAATYELFKTTDTLGNDISDESGYIKIGSDRNADGTYSYSPNGGSTEYITDDNGLIKIVDLPEGKYFFTETLAPDAYHINNSAAERVSFEIGHSTYEAVNKAVNDHNTRINAKLKLTKYKADGTTVLSGAVFDVSYRPVGSMGAYTSIGTAVTDNNGVLEFTQGIYNTAIGPEGLRRGDYLLTEIKSDDQMLNSLTDSMLGLYDSKRNTVKFSIGNETGRTYVVDNSDLFTVSGYIALTENGVKDTAIPTKTITMTKVWEGDSSLVETFRPTEIYVRLYRSYAIEGSVSEEPVGEVVTVQRDADGRYICSWSDQPAYINVGAGTTAEPQTTFLYTYYVKEENTAYGYTWSETHPVTGAVALQTGDGDVSSTLTNTMKTGTLKLSKTVQGITEDPQEFKVRVKLTSDGTTAVGNIASGLYIDSYKLDGTITAHPDTENGWMTIKAGQTIEIELPAGVRYEIEEQQPDGTNTKLEYVVSYSGKTGTISEGGTNTGIITNNVKKQLRLTKLDDTDRALALSGAKFHVYHNGTDLGEFITGTDGVLVKDGTELDLTAQGTYTIYETAAPTCFITPTNNSGEPTLLAEITVDATNTMTVVSKNSALVVKTVIDSSSEAADSANRQLAVINVKNEKTRAEIGKTVDYANAAALSGAKLKLIDTTDNTQVGETWTTDSTNNPIVFNEGVLKEGRVYKLEEVQAPNGYLEADAIYFRLEGTYTRSGERWSRIVITDAAGSAVSDQNTSGTTYGAPGVYNGVLNMVDETIKAPVTLTKLVPTAAGSGSNEALPGALFDVFDNDTNEKLGVAKTIADGTLVWDSISDAGVAGGHIYSVGNPGYKGTVITADYKAAAVNAGTIVLRQNLSGYTFTETYAPDHAYMDGRSYLIVINDNDYTSFRADGTYMVNIVERNTQKLQGDTETEAVDPHFEAELVLYKYDAEAEQTHADHNNPLANAQFTLYKGETPMGVFTTGSDGKLTVIITEKGSYTLKETGVPEGYNKAADMSFTIVNADYSKTLTYSETADNHTADTAAGNDIYDLPDDRIHGELTLNKQDDTQHTNLSNVHYSLKRLTDNVNDAWFVKDMSIELETGFSYVLDTEKSSADEALAKTNGTAGVLKISGLQWGVYELTESTELDGYILDTTTYAIELTNENRKATVSGDTVLYNQSETGIVTNRKNELTIVKTALDGITELNGAKFRLLAVDESGNLTNANYYTSRNSADAVSDELVFTGSTGTIYGLTKGHYVLQETLAPEGYELAQPVYFEMNEYGEVGNVKACTIENSAVTVGNGNTALAVNAISGSGKNTANTLTIKDTPIELTLVKWDSTVNAILSQTYFSYARFTVTGQFANESAQTTTPELCMDEARRGSAEAPYYLPDYLKAKLVAGRTYTITETYAPDGYELQSSSASLYVGTDGSITVTSVNTGFIRTDNTGADGVAKLTYDNERIRLKLTKQDSDDNSRFLSGVEFKLSPAEGSAFAEAYSGTVTENTVTLTTDENGALDIPDLLLKYDNSYILTETGLGTNKSYRLAENESDRSIAFKVNSDGTAEITTANEFFKLDSEDTTHFVIVNDPIEFEISKIDDETHEAVTGAVLHLNRLNSDGSTSARPENALGWDWTTGTASHTIKYLEPGRYVISEDALSGYIRIPPVYFTLKQNGSVERTDENGAAYAEDGTKAKLTVTDPVDGKLDSHTTFTLENRKNKLTLEKTDSDGTRLSNSELVNEAVFNIIKPEGETALSFILNAEKAQYEFSTSEGAEPDISAGIAVIRGIPEGSYTLREVTAPAGYKLAADIIFSVDAYGEFSGFSTLPTGSTENFVFANSDKDGLLRAGSLQVNDKPIEITLHKVGETGADSLTGAVFELSDACAEEGHAFADKSTDEIILNIEAEDGKLLIPKNKLIAGHTYKLIETKAPDGYECTAELSFKVEANGELSEISGDTVMTEGGFSEGESQHIRASAETGETLAIANEKIRLSLVKYDGDNTETKLEGVVFTITPAGESDDFADIVPTLVSGESYDSVAKKLTLTTNAEGKLIVPEGFLKHDNSYILTEISLGENTSYRLPRANSLEFTVEKNGELTYTGNDIFSDNSATEISVKNYPITLEVVKLDQATGTALPGVTLKLSKLGESGSFEPFVLAGKTDSDGCWTTGSDGSITFKDVTFTPGTYKLEETATVNSYNQITEAITFVIDSEGMVTSAGTESVADIAPEGTGENEITKNFFITNPEDAKPGKITLRVVNAAYSYLQLTKLGSDNARLSGVRFRLDYKSNGSWQYVSHNADGSAAYPVSSGSEAWILSTDSNGNVTFGKLPDGDYRLTELQTAAGYNLLSVPLYIRIDRNTESYKLSDDEGFAEGLTTTLQRTDMSDTITMTVVNQKGFVLPATGGTTAKLPFVILPITAALEALVLWLYQSNTKKRRKEGANA